MKRLFAVAAVLMAAGLAAALVAEEAATPQAPDVLILQGGGTPSDAKITPETVDAVSCPTPVAMNCGTLAEQVAGALRAKGLSVRVAAADQVRHRREITAARLVVLGSPCYFSNASWKMHKLFDEKFHEVLLASEKRFGGKPFATFALGKSEPKSLKTLEAMETVVTSCLGTVGPRMVVLADQPAEKIKEAVGKFADEIAGQLKAGE